jgi:hypothetical protein
MVSECNEKFYFCKAWVVAGDVELRWVCGLGAAWFRVVLEVNPTGGWAWLAPGTLAI